MRKFTAVFASLILLTAISSAKTAPQEVPQTARQALMEMFFSKEAGTFVKHLPAATRATLTQSGALASLQQYSAFTGQLQAQGKGFQTFETGSVLFATEDPKTGQKVETIVENDSLQGDEDDIELSFQTYKDGQPHHSVFMPHMTFTMKLESSVWTLNEIAVTVHLPLADPYLLKTISDGMKAHASAGIPQPQMQTATPSFGSDAKTLSDVRTILSAEITYAATYPTVGYTCTLADLDGFGGGEPNEHQAMLISSSLASGKHDGYAMMIQCGRSPATTFRLTATPIGQPYGRRTFCADQSGAIKASAASNACFSNGAPVQ